MQVIAHTPLVLASSSAVRQQMLKHVGVPFSVVPSGVDESAIKEQMKGQPPQQLAQALARAKTLHVAKQYPDRITIGADQLCVSDEGILDKPGSVENAVAQLRALSGRTHRQLSAVCLARGEDVLWEACEHAELTMRTLSDDEICGYITQDEPLHSCGAYKFESMGRHLFAQVRGNDDVIKGLPLVPLLAQLYALGAISLAS